MRIQDNRHLKYDSNVQLGDMVLTDNGKYYLFTCDEDEEYPYLQINIETFEVVEGYSKDRFDNFKEGSSIEGGIIKEIFKNKNLIIDIRS